MFGRKNCNLRNFLEATAAFHYRIKLRLRGAKIVEGIALNVRSNRNKNACIEVLTDDGIDLIEIDQIKFVDVITPNAKFNKVPSVVQ